MPPEFASEFGSLLSEDSSVRRIVEPLSSSPRSRLKRRHSDVDSVMLNSPSSRKRCVLCGSLHDHNVSCACFRCGHRHQGDCLTVCRNCRQCHSASSGCRHSPAQYFTALRKSMANFSNDVTNGVHTPVARHNLGDMNIVCPHCHARTWRNEKLNCCHGGDVVVPWDADVPQLLSSVILSAHVRQNIRAYNTVVAFASTGHTNKSLIGGTFVLGGRSYHRIGSLLPESTAKHSFSQIWTLDTDDATSRRLEIMPALRSHVLSSLHDLLLQHNRLAQMYRSAVDYASNLSSDLLSSIGFSWSATEELSQFQVASIIERAGFKRNIEIKSRSGKCINVHDGHQLYHSLAYPLLFPTGSSGWHYDYQHNGRKISLTEYMRFLLMHRSHPSHLQRCERLSLEFYCDAFAQVESRNLAFHQLASQQAKYQVASARAIMDQISVVNARQIGVPTVLPASFPNSPRFYYNLYLDAVALPRKFGKPDLFITMTANPNWPEISQALPDRSHWSHHQDIVDRVFYMKLKAMLDIIIKKRLFGEVLAYVYRIEWQARGMPHAHCLFILRNKILSPREIDSIVWAEIPCPQRYPVLHEIVCRRMIHDPCDIDENAHCLKKNGQGTCYRHFPKKLNSVTSIVGDGYPEYRRRNLFSAFRNGRTIDDRWVVPYNRHLLEMFDCHINVEICAHKRCFKYVYKYCFKRPDAATVAIDEIDSYISGRLLTASEAVWRLLGLKLHKEYPSVERLDVHLPDQQHVIYDPTSDPRDIFEAAERSSSTLLEWFALNIRDVSARQYLYSEIPEHYVWHHGTWMPRSKTSCISIGRMYNVSIYNYELFSLRTLLSCQRGCQSFSDVLMVDGYIHNTFRAACSAFGFIHDDSEFVACFSEYLETTIASQASIRQQFAFMLCAIKVLNAKMLFEHFSLDLCGDESRQQALIDIEQHMQKNGKSLRDDDFQFDDVPSLNLYQESEFIVNLEMPPLSQEQQTALETIIAMWSDACITDKVMSVVAPAGTGKTLFVHHAASRLHHLGCNIMCVAASCLAATLMPQGKTAHSAFKIPLNCDNMTYCNWKHDLRNQLRSVDVVFWDEISMVNYHVVETVDRSFRQLMDSEAMFGGKVFVFLGDFRQLPPVIRGGRGEHFSLMASDWFHAAARAVFTQNFRSRDAQYASLLEQIGDGEIDSVDIPSESVALNLNDAIDRVYGNDITNENNIGNMMLAFTLDQCAIVNEAVAIKITGCASCSVACDDLSECKNPDDYPHEYVASLNIHGAPPANLTLKTGARYMIIRNLSSIICNGVLAEAISFSRWQCSMRLLTGPGAGQTVKLPRCSFHITSENSGLPFNFCRRQFPITMAYCVTVHKSQGQTLKNIGIIADTDPFAHGMVYVALSRVGSWNNVIFYSPREESFIKNKVCKKLTKRV